MMTSRAAVALLALALSAPAAAQVTPRFDVPIPMRDGVRLTADIYLPADTLPVPLLLVRTPYRTDMAVADFPGLARYFGAHGYGLIVQDVRGQGDAGGEFDFFFQEAADGHDTIEWIARQPWSNGRLCMFGSSYLGTAQWLAAKERPAALKCLVSAAPAGRYGFEELPYVGGAFMMQWALGWTNLTAERGWQSAAGVDWDAVFAHRPLVTMDSVMGRRMQLYRDFLEHATSGPYWDRIRLGQEAFRGIDLPVLHVTGWFDGDQPGALHYFRGMRAHSPARDRQYLVVGPWNHGHTFADGLRTLGALEFGDDAIVDKRALRLAFFDRYLKGTGAFDRAPARIFFTGSNEWRDFDDYPPPGMSPQPLYLHSGGRANTRFGDGALGWEPPGQQPPDRFTYDPMRPVSSELGAADDHRPLERRDDVLVYTTEPLDQPLDIAGPVFVELHAASDAPDTDFVVKLLDVFPDGRAVALGPLGLGVRRARYRNGYDREQLLTPGAVETYRIELYDIAHTFLAGHRVRIHVTSSAAPMFNPNQNTGNPVATDTEWRVAHQTIYHDAARPSAVHLPVLPNRRRRPHRRGPTRERLPDPSSTMESP